MAAPEPAREARSILQERFVPVAVQASSAAREIRIELSRKGTAVTVTWPVAAATEFAVWLHEVLR